MKKLSIILLILSASLYYVWNFVGTRPGEQKVKFDPAEKECFAEPSEDSEIVEIAKKRGLNLKWQPLYGGHCAVDVNSFADFLL